MKNRIIKYAAFLLSLLLIVGNLTFIQPLAVHAATMDNGVTIKAIDENGEEVFGLTAIEIDEGDTAFDVLLEAGEKKDKEIQYDEYDFGNYVTGIGKVLETDTHSWSFNVNGKAADVGASSFEVENGDNVLFALRDLDDFSPEVSISVTATDINDNAIINREVAVATGSSAYDALYQAAAQEDLSLDVSVDDSLLTFINNVGETDLGPNDYWNVAVDNEALSTSIADHPVQEGQEVQLQVTTYEPPEEVDEEEETPSEEEEAPAEETENESKTPADKETPAINAKQVQVNVGDILSYMDAASIQLTSGSEWWVWGVAHTNREIPDSYVESIEALVKDNEGEFRNLFELEKIIIALSAVGKDASDINGINLIDKLATHSWMEEGDPAINAAIYGLLAIDSAEFAVSEDFRTMLITSILDKELEDGGWSFFGSNPSPDITGMALAALAPYKEDPKVKTAIDRAVTYLAESQDAEGGYDIEFNGGDSSESVSQAIIGLAAVGADPTSPSFTKEGGNLLQHLLKFKQEDGGYSHLLDGGSTDMSTQQALLAFVAYQKLVNGTGSVYQFSAPVEEEPPNEPEQPEDPEDTEKPEADPNQPGTDDEPKDEDPKPEKGDNTSDNGKNNETNEHVKQLENAGDKQTNASGEKLPNTSTNTFNFLASGLVLLLIGGAIFLMWRKRQANESM
ncbi:pullulanase, extracellular [Oceanobacillus picturae]|uniref:Pullulanase, extracellular n=1 Tax=Oceanobacillus picturae TaxID=171693 RepID=A0A0U9H7K4_9BACI|nr:DUF4430 domain-containing protein [Oceanobacillus picturae]GAQ18645.1 pullulanase, extracellular [Oceanobacillus picturae]